LELSIALSRNDTRKGYCSLTAELFSRFAETTFCILSCAEAVILSIVNLPNSTKLFAGRAEVALPEKEVFS
jgi:hypothetical protein